MSVLGSVSYNFSSDVQPLLDSSKKAEESFGRVDKAAEKLDKSIGKLEKSHSVLGKAIKGIAIGGAGVGLGLLTKHLLAGTKAGDTLGKGLTYLQAKTAILKTHVSGLLAPTTAWIQSTKTGTAALGGLSKGLEHATKAYQRVDEVAGTAASTIKTYTSGLVEAGKAGTLIPKVTEQATAAFTGMKTSIASNVTSFKSWLGSLASSPPAVAALTGGVKSAGGAFSNFTRILGQTWNAFNTTFEQMERAGLGAAAMTGKFGTGAVKVSHFSGMVGLLGLALSFLPGPLGIVAGLVATATAGIDGLIFALGSVISYIGDFASAIGERLTVSLREYVALSSQAEVGILGFNTAIKAYNDHVEGASINTSQLDEWMRKLSIDTGISTNEIRQITLRTLELSRITGLSTEQVKLLTERAIDLATAMHRDVWDGVWSVIDAMRGFPSMASGFGLALDNASLSSSEFAAALGTSYKAMNNNQQAQVIYQETMKQSAWAAGFAAKMVGSTLVGSEMKAEVAIERLNTAIGVGVQTVWQPWSSVMSSVVSLLNYLPAPMVQAYGTLKALTAMAFNAAGGFLSLATKIVMVSAGFKMLSASGPLVLSTLNFLMQRLKLINFSFLYLSDAVRSLSVIGLVGLRAAIKETAIAIGHAALAMGKWLLNPWVLIIGGIALAIYGLVKAYQHLHKTSEEVAKDTQEAVDLGSQHIIQLKATKVAIEDSTKSERDKRLALAELIDAYPEVLSFLEKDQLETKKIVEGLDAEILKREELNKLLKEKQIEKATEDVKKEEAAYSSLERQLAKTTKAVEKNQEILKKEREKPIELQRPSVIRLYEHYNNIQLETAKKLSAEMKKSNEGVQAAQKHLDSQLGTQKKIGVVLAEGEGYQVRAITLGAEELKVVQEQLSELEKIRDTIQETYTAREALINETYDLERSRASSLSDTLQEMSSKNIEFEQEVLRKREDILSSYQSGLIGLTTTTNKEMIEGFQSSSEGYFNQLVRLEQERMTVHRRAAEVFTSEAQKEVATIVKFNAFGLKEMAKASDDFIGPVQLLASKTSESLDEIKGYYGSFGDKVQEAYKYITGSQENFLDALKRTGPYTEDVINNMTKLAIEVNKSYAEQIKDAENMISHFEKSSGRMLTASERQIKMDELQAKKAQDMMKIYTQVYDTLSARQNSLIAKQAESFAKLRAMEQDYLSRQTDMEDILLGLQREAGERTVDDRTRFYSKMRDLEGRLQAAQMLTAEDRKKVDQELISSAVSLRGEITDADGKVLVSKQEVARFITTFVTKAYEDEKTASQAAITQVESEMSSRSAAIADVGDKIAVLRSHMAAMKDDYDKLVRSISETRFGMTEAVALDAQRQAGIIHAELKKLVEDTYGVKISIDDDAASKAKNSIQQLHDFVKRLLDPSNFVVKVTADIAQVKEQVRAAIEEAAQGEGISLGTIGGAIKKAFSSVVSGVKNYYEEVGTPQGKQQGGEVTGRIPGFGGGDRVPLSAAPGQFVLRKEAVQKYGSGFLSRLSRVPAKELGGSQSRVPILAERGEFMVPRRAVDFHGSSLFDSINRMKFQEGGKIRKILENNRSKPFVDRILNWDKYPVLNLGQGNIATHKMAWSEVDGKNVVYPTIVLDGKQLKQLSGKDALARSMKTGDYISFATPQEADWFSKNYKSVWEGKGPRGKQEGGQIGGGQSSFIPYLAKPLQEAWNAYVKGGEESALKAYKDILSQKEASGSYMSTVFGSPEGVGSTAPTASSPRSLGRQEVSQIASMAAAPSSIPAAPITDSGSTRPGRGAQKEVSLDPAKKSASNIEGIFDTMFKNLENKAKNASVDIGNALFENIYNKLRDRMVREAKQG